MFASPQAANSAPVSLHLNGYYQQPLADPTGEPAKGESVLYKIPPAFWIFFFLFVGYVGVRMVMED